MKKSLYGTRTYILLISSFNLFLFGASVLGSDDAGLVHSSKSHSIINILPLVVSVCFSI